MNAANEEAANAFLRGDLPFGKIPVLIEECMARHDVQPAGLESLLDADRWARETSQALMELL
jgi:1-deoxy-D-xylulose-5-phosphate reductoisomerase